MDIAKKLSAGRVGVMPTDTLYGLVGQALAPTTVERIYHIKRRAPHKPFVILIAALGDLAKFGVEPTPDSERVLKHYWPGPVSIILPCLRADLFYLHRGTHSLAFRLPDKPDLVELIKEVGPLVVPSANPEGHPPATSLAQAQEYFGDKVDFYVDGGTLEGQPSKLIRVEHGREIVERP